MLGKVLNERYKILKELGKGGMAIVFEAQDLLLDRKVALKMLRPEYVNDKDFVKRFRHEAKAVARLSHPNVVNIFDIGQDEDYQYLVMEDIEGDNLKDLINERGPLDVVEALNIAKQISAALVVAHRNNIIHCDIKPHNILLTDDKQVKVTDFGIARAVTSTTMTITDTIVGSAHYFSPEQARGGEIKARSDLYSLGIVLYEMLTGEVPFRGDSPISVALKHIQETPKKPTLINPDIPSNIEKLVIKAIAKNPAERFITAENMKNEIESILRNYSNESFKNRDSIEHDDTMVIKKSELKNSKLENRNGKNAKNEKKYLTYNESKASSPWVKWLVLVFAFIMIAALGLFIFYRNYMDVPVVEVPDIIGMNLKDARKEVAQVGLQLEMQNEGVHHPEIAEGNIISQYPLGGERVRQTRNVRITVSLGPAILTAPDLAGLTIREANVILDNQKLFLGNIEEEYSESIPEGRIISQLPETGEEIGSDNQINIVLSKGAQPLMIEVPNILGLEQEDAVNLLKNKNFTIGQITQKMTKRFLSNQVAEQSYDPGTEIPEGSKIDLTISSGLINTENAILHKGFTMKYYVPSGSWEQAVEIVIIDNNGKDTIYKGNHNPGDNISVYFNSVGPTRYEIYINNQLLDQGKVTD